MTKAPDIRFIGMEASGALAALARDRAEELDRVHAGILSCQVAIALERRSRGVPQFRVSVDLVTAPGDQLTEIRGDGEDVYSALSRAFDHSRLRLEHAAARRPH